jgi:predicted house-cleaning NTP pyrophosphatase (Maf/HAM1 superfamily)
VEFRFLEADEIERYLQREQPWDCAGAFKSEGYGIVLTRRIDGPDPTALVGLPLIRLAEMLRSEGLSLP